MEWTQYRRKGVSEMRPYLPGEDLTGISVSKTDQPPVPGGMIARNPQNHADQWYVALQYFQENFAEVERGRDASNDGASGGGPSRSEEAGNGTWSCQESVPTMYDHSQRPPHFLMACWGKMSWIFPLSLFIK